MQRSDIDLFLDIKTECEIIIEYSGNKNLQDLFTDKLLSRAMERSLEIIGEAVKHLSDDTKQKYSSIEWRKIAGLRDVIIHQYFGVDYELIWDIIINKIPILYIEIDKILENKK